MSIQSLTPTRSLMVAIHAALIVVWTNSTASAQSEPQSMRPYPFRIVDADGEPIADATVDPWALRSSQGHGSWDGEKHPAEVQRQSVTTDADGRGIVHAPMFADVAEQVKVIDVTISIDHPEHPAISHVFLFDDGTHTTIGDNEKRPGDIVVPRGGRIAVHATIGGEPVDNQRLRFIGADWQRSPTREPPKIDVESGAALLPVLPPGPTDFLAVLVDEQNEPTHFSQIIYTTVEADQTNRLAVALEPSIRVFGNLDVDVPRPIENGRVVASTLPKNSEADIRWSQTVDVDADGSFVLPHWPAGETVQAIAVCEGYIATRGEKPSVVENDHPVYLRAQCFDASTLGDGVEIAMEPMQNYRIRLLDPDGRPLTGILVSVNPNVQWWNDGSTIYADPGWSDENIFQPETPRRSWLEDVQRQGYWWSANSDSDGFVNIRLPQNHRMSLDVYNPVYQLPISMGHRSIRIPATTFLRLEQTHKLQYKGEEYLGEWDRLAGVLFGCGTHEGRRLLSLPGVSEKMDEFAKKYRRSKALGISWRTPEAFELIAEGFELAGEPQEAKKWRQKGDELRETPSAEETENPESD